MKEEQTPLLIYDDFFGMQVKAFSTIKVYEENNVYKDFNLSYQVTSNKENDNYKKLSAILGINEEKIIRVNQVHGDTVLIINSISNKNLIKSNEADAIITNQKNLCIGITTADCIPLLLYDKDKEIIAAIHAGWKGTVLEITTKTINLMMSYYSTNPQHLFALIGPGISIDYFEIGNEVYEKFLNLKYPIELYSTYIKNKWHIDLQKLNFLQLENMGIPLQQISIINRCTYRNNNLFYSARREGVNTGRFFSGIYMQ